jgi:hypothetical protein
VIGYFESPLDCSQVLLGNRWLSRRTGGFIVAPSGHGKSTLVIQATVGWSCGRIEFAIKPVGPLRILIVQSEDDDNDITEMAQMVDRLKLTAAERELVRANTHIEWMGPAERAILLALRLGLGVSQAQVARTFHLNRQQAARLLEKLSGPGACLRAKIPPEPAAGQKSSLRLGA